MQNLGGALLLVSVLMLSACSGSAVLLQSQAAGSSGTSSNGSSMAGSSGGSSAGGSSGADSGAASDAGGPAPGTCGDLPERDLHSVEEVKAALTASPAFPYPGGWSPCAASIQLCQVATPGSLGNAFAALSFDTSVTELQCGGNFESGFSPYSSFPITIVDTGQNTNLASPAYELRLQTDTGLKHYALSAQGELGGAVGFKLLDPDVNPPAWVTFEPLPSLP